MDYRFTKDPGQYAAFFLAENKVTHPDFEYIIHLDEPRCFIKYHVGLAMFASYEEFYDHVAEVQWIDGVPPSKDEQKRIMTMAWNYLAIEERILEADHEEMEGDDEW